MSLDSFKKVEAVIASAAAASGEIVMDKNYNNLYLEIPTMASAGTINITAATVKSGTFYQVYGIVDSVATLYEAYAPNGALVQLPPGLRFMKLSIASAPTAATTFNVIGCD